MTPEHKLKKFDETSMVLRIKLAVHFGSPSKQSRHDVDEALGDMEEYLDRLLNPWLARGQKSKVA